MKTFFDKYSHHTHSYIALRKSVGWIGLLLPFMLMLGDSLIFRGPLVENSISYYYHTGMGDVFVGALCAVALFLFFYSGYDKWDDWAGNLGGIFALGVAWFPMTKSGPPDWADRVHLVSAILFFLVLAAFSLLLFTKTEKGRKPEGRKKKRNGIYVACGIIMLASLATIAVFKFWLQDDHPEWRLVFWGETAALVAFGISWLTKGEAIYPDME
jgi:hypothetical protein